MAARRPTNPYRPFPRPNPVVVTVSIVVYVGNPWALIIMEEKYLHVQLIIYR